MAKFFVPYVDDLPAVADIKGHRVLLVGSQKEDFMGELELIGADELREIDLPIEDLNHPALLARLGAEHSSGVVLSPPGISPSKMIRSLEDELLLRH